MKFFNRIYTALFAPFPSSSDCFLVGTAFGVPALPVEAIFLYYYNQYLHHIMNQRDGIWFDGVYL